MFDEMPKPTTTTPTTSTTPTTHIKTSLQPSPNPTVIPEETEPKVGHKKPNERNKARRKPFDELFSRLEEDYDRFCPSSYISFSSLFDESPYEIRTRFKYPEAFNLTDFFQIFEEFGDHVIPFATAETKGQVISGSWDRTVKCWDPRCTSGKEHAPLGTYRQPERVYSLSLVGNRLVVATAGRHINVYDLRNMSKQEQWRQSPLKYQTRCIRCYPDGTGFALSSVEGRVAMEFFDLSEAGQAKKYAFKCHRKSEAGKDIVYPVNTIAFHPIYGTFATGGCDGYVNVWDGNNKKRLYQYTKYPTSISALSFSRDGRMLAVASSYTYEYGNKPHEPDGIFVRNIQNIEVKPKPKAYPNPV